MAHAGFLDKAMARSPSLPKYRPSIGLRQIPAADLSAADIAGWLDLEHRALEPNAYLSPHFVMPALRHLGGLEDTQVLLLEEKRGGRTSVQALAVLQGRTANRTMPAPHRSAYLSVHSFLGGLLVARDGARQHLEALCDGLGGRFGHGLVMESCSVDGPTDQLLRQVALERGMRRCESYGYQRATMVPNEMGEAFLAGPLSSRNKKLRSLKTKLGKQGEVRFEVLRGKAVDDTVIEHHLALEHMGWKGESGTSMRSNPAHEAFFREMASGFAASERALFAQLSVGGRVIASTSNFIAGNSGFAFKIGFDPDFSHFGPGKMCELEFMRSAPEVAGDLDCFDSGSVAGSYLETMWPRRRGIATVVYATSLAGNFAMACSTQLRCIKQMFTRHKAAPTHVAPPHAQQASGE
jgi:CelD/BcsL family acetyltransferase involved in cellulose biosynthesis